MENNAETAYGAHPQVPPAKPPDWSDDQPNGENPAHVHNEAMSEDEATTTATMEEQPMTAAASENGVSPVIMSTIDPGGDHVGTAVGGPEVIPQNHVGARNHGPGEIVPNPTPNQGAAGTENLGPGDDAPPPYPGNEPGTLNPRNPRNPNLIKVTKGHFDRSMNNLIDATRDLAQDQHRDNLKLEANVGITLQISQDLMQYLNEFQENMKGSHRILHEKMATMCSKIANMETAVENSANAALERGETTNVKTLITEMAEEVKKQGRSMEEHTKVSEKIEGLLRENQSPMVRQDKKRVRVQSPASEAMIHEGASNVRTSNQQTPVPKPQGNPTNTRPPSSAPQRADPPGTVIHNGSLATTFVAPSGRQVLRKPGPAPPGPTGANPSAGTSRVRVLSNGSRVNTYIGEDGQETLRLSRLPQQGQNRNTSGPGARPKGGTYAAAAAIPAAPTQTRPGPIPENQRNNRGANQGQAGHGSKTDKQPSRVKDDHYEICPDTGNFIRVEAYKTVPYRSEKQKGQENKRHLKNLAQVMRELVLFGIPTKTSKGDIMTSAQDRLYIAKFLRELRRYGYTAVNGHVVGNVRQWRNTRHPDHIPITLTFCDEDTRFRVEEAALEAGLKGHRTPREGDEQHGRIGYIRRSLTERERKELKTKKEKRNSPAGIAFAEIRKREEDSRANHEDWADFNLEGDEDPIIDMEYAAEQMAEHVEPPVNETENNNNNNPTRGSAMSEEAMINKMEEMQRTLDAMRAEKEQAEAETIRAAEEIIQNEEAADSDIEFRDPISGRSTRLSNRRGSLATSIFGTPRASPSICPNVFATEPVFDFTGNLNLDRPNLARQENTHTDTPEGGDESDSECEFE